jgi:hypothetical protein
LGILKDIVMANHMSNEDIQMYLKEEFEETESIEKAFDQLLTNVHDLFEMNEWDEPNFYELIIPFEGNQYKITIEEDGLCESRYDHIIMYWSWTIEKIN